VDFVAVMEQAIALLRQRGRVTYRTLKLQFTLDEEQLATLKDELLYSQPQVVDDALLPTSPRESRFSMAYSHPYEGNPMTWRTPCRSRPRCTRSTNLTN